MSATKTDETIGIRIRGFRVAKNLSQENIADELGISVSAYSNLERGKTEFTINRILQISIILSVHWLDLIDLALDNDKKIRSSPSYSFLDEISNLRDAISQLQKEVKSQRDTTSSYTSKKNISKK